MSVPYPDWYSSLGNISVCPNIWSSTRQAWGLVHIWSMLLRKHQRKSENMETADSSHLRIFFFFLSFGNSCVLLLSPSSFLTFLWTYFLFICLSSSVLTFYDNPPKKQYMVSYSFNFIFVLCATLFMINRYKPIFTLLRIVSNCFLTFTWIPSNPLSAPSSSYNFILLCYKMFHKL